MPSSESFPMSASSFASCASASSDASAPSDAPAASAASGRPLIRLEHVNVTVQGVPALTDVSLTIHAGRHMALLGPNGAGKSTLLRVLRGETRPDQRAGGTVRWFPAGTEANPACAGDDAPLTGRAMTALLSPGLQEHYMRQGWTIRGEELVIAGCWDDYLLYREPSEAQRREALDLGRRFGAGALLDRPVNTLSQGQLRILLLMRALIRHPQVLLLDEADDGLDAPTRCMFLILLASLTQLPDPPTIILTSHRARLPGFVRLAAHLEAGALRGPFPWPPSGQGAPENSATAPPPAPRRFPLPRVRRTAVARPEGVDIELRHATVFVERAEVLHAITWAIQPGEQWTVLGGNGAGKSTLLRLLMGEEAVAVGGSIRRVLPRHGGVDPDLAHIQRGIRLVSDRLQALYTYNETVADVVFSGLDGSVGVYREADDAEREEVARSLREAGLEALADRPFRSLSTGQARRTLLARALVGDPELLLLDEPFSGLDADSREAMIALLEARIAQGLQTVLVSHHDEDRLPSSAHTARLREGRMVETGCITPWRPEDQPA